MIKEEGEMLKRIVSEIILIMILMSVFPLAFGIQPLRVNASSQGETAQAAEVDWWPMFHHDLTHSGYSTSTAPNTNQLAWSFKTGGSVYSSPAVVNGMVYVSSYDFKVYALNASTGAYIWSYTTNGETDSSPAVADGRVFVGTGSGRVYALNATTGILLWNYTTGGPVDSSPAVSSGLVYVGSYDHKVYALNAFTGALVWNYTTGSEVFSSPAIADGKLYVGSDDSRVYALNATTGALIWSYNIGNSVFGWSSPAVADGKIFVGSSGNGEVYALNATTGGYIWNYTTTPGYPVTSSPAVAGSIVYVGSIDSKVYTLNASTGALIWSYTTGNAIWSSPAVANGKVYVGSLDYKVYSLNASTGKLIWTYTTGSYVNSSPAVADGRVYVGSGDGKVYAFGTPLPVVISPGSVTMDVGEVQFFTSTVSKGTPPFSYQWYLNGVAVSGAIGDWWGFNPSSVGTYAIYLKVTDATGVSTISNTVTVPVNAALSVSISPSAVVMDYGQTQLFTSNLTGGTSPYSYQWYLYFNYQFAPISGETGPTLNFATSKLLWVWGDCLVYLEVTDGACVTATSNYVSVTVNEPLAVSIVGSDYVHVGQSAGFASARYWGTPPFAYQWYLNGSAVANATDPAWDFIANSSGSYNVYVNVTDGVDVTAESNIGTVIVYPALHVTIWPSSATLDAGQTQLFTSRVSGGTGSYSYQWYIDNSPVSGARSATWWYTPNSKGFHTIFLEVSDDAWARATSSATSNASTVSVNPWLFVVIAPTSVTLDVAQSRTFTSNITGGMPPYTYQWYLNGSLVSGAINATWLFTPSSPGFYAIFLKVTDNLGWDVASKTASMTVNGLPTVSISPTWETAQPSSEVTLTSTILGGTAPYSYQWYLDGNKVLTATTPAWTFTPAKAGTYNVYLSVTDSTNTTALSNLALIIVTTPSVGGVSAPITTFSLLTPWLSIVLLLAAAVLLKGFIAKKNQHI
jgi:outer membrane protein assembly factor BamB